MPSLGTTSLETPGLAPVSADHGAILDAILRLGLVSRSDSVRLEPLTGGVASDIYRVDAPAGHFVVKRALAKLRVAADWRVPVERNAYEVAWLRLAGEAVPGSAPAILGHDAA